LTNYLSVAKNGPNAINQNRPIDKLDHSYGPGNWISDNELQELAQKKYEINGKGITFYDLMKLGCSQQKAQRRLKNAYLGKIEKDGKKSSILFTLDNGRTKPQQYFPSCIRATIIENKRNRPIDPTGANYNNKGHSSSTYQLHNAIENQIVQSFLLQLYLLPWQPLNMHNIHLWTIIDKSHYEELKVKPAFNKTKIVRERIGLREVIYKLNKKGSIEIDIACSTKPFQIETDDDVNNFFIFLGKVQYTLVYILSDPRERIVPPVDKWILKYCDFNKDIELDDKNIGQFMDLNIQIKYAGEAFRLYVKNLEDRFALRGEKVVEVNQPITSFMNNSILTPLHLIDTKFNEFTKIIINEVKQINNKIEKLEKES
jgi:hypothetical protein